MDFVDIHQSHCYPDNNASCLKTIRKKEIYLFFYVFAAVVIVLTVFGNLLVIISVSHFKQLHTPTNLLVLSLAVVDFLIGLFVIPFEFSEAIEECWYFGETICPFYINYSSILVLVSVLNLMTISVDRYIAVCHPFFYSTEITNARMGFCIILIWLVALVYTVIFIYFTGGEIVADNCVGMCRLFHYQEWWIVHFIANFALPVSVMIFLYGVIFLVVRSHARAIRSVVQNVAEAESKKRTLSKSSERKAAKTLGIVVVVFIIFVSPSYLLNFLALSLSASNKLLTELSDSFFLLSNMNSGVNPYIYAFFYSWFRQAVKMILTFKITSPASSLSNFFTEK
ncbi:trace amine-associated receptor 9-like [Erpetoichthys calabaricus]|uniref:trace amine-associated receptor 9-like n=1 Tax=Erpetoichthys calabaricus TaxID=27687 RepID=UPI0022341462|nr:trace amine-associated receptor 9-like [Erpetoichthys calabaricus]